MKTNLVLMSVLVVLLLLAGCQKANTQTIATDGGEIKVTGEAKNTNAWCQAGSEWKTTSTGEGAGTAKMVIEGIVSSGKYAGYCHVTYDVSTESGSANVDYYFKEDGSGYQVMNVNGQKFESQWTGQ